MGIFADQRTGVGTSEDDVRVGARLLAVVGALYVAGLLGRGPFIDPVRSPAAFAEAMASPRVIASGFAYVVAMAVHVIAKSYLQGNASAIDIVTMAAVPLFIGSVLLEGVLITAGSILLAWAIARAGHPKWITLAYAVSAPLYATPVTGFVAEVLGSAILLVAAIALARRRAVAAA